MEHNWPALRGWKDIPETISTRRAVYGKVHRAPTDYRWIAWSAGFGSSPPTRERELIVNTHKLSAASIGWRYAPTTGPFAVRFYASRAFDAAGRPGGVEKQILAPLPEAYATIPPVALAFLLLDAASPFDDTIWWDHWRNPAWTSMSHYLSIDEKDCPRLDIGQLDAMIEQGLSELLDGVDESRLVLFYSQLLAGASPAVLMTQGTTLSPLAMAALLLPLERSQTEELSIAGGVSPARDASKVAEWNEIVCTIDNAPPLPGDTRDGARLVELLKLGQANGGQFPAPPSLGGLFLEGFVKSEGRWLAPGTLGTEALRTLGPWSTVKSPREAAGLRNLITDFMEDLRKLKESGGSRDELNHKATKYELLQSLLVVLCPGPETYQVFQFGCEQVPALYFISRIEPEDWNDLAGRYTRDQFLNLAAHSLEVARIGQLARAVRDFLLEQAQRDQSGLMAQYAAAALSASSP